MPKLISCHPELDSDVKVAVARRLPALLQRFPICLPVFSALLKKRIPVMYPPISEVNLTPTSVPEVSPESATVGELVPLQMVHGHAADVEEVPVVKDHVKFDGSALPCRFCTAELLDPPLTMAVYVVELANPLVGVNTAVFVAEA